MPGGRPTTTLSSTELEVIHRAVARVRRAETQLSRARQGLAKAALQVGKPAALARAVGVDISTVRYWLRTLEE